MALIINNKPVDDTDNVVCLLDNRKLSWHPGDNGTDVCEKITQIVGHWTAGAEHTGGSTVVKNMKSRKGKSGKPLRVGIHFVIAAPKEGQRMATIYQAADPGVTRCIHVGQRVVNRQSIGIEVVNAADPRLGWAVPGLRGLKSSRQLGKTREWTAFYESQLHSFVWLCDVLCQEFNIEKNTFVSDKRLDLSELRKYNGVLEHWNVGGTTKLDAGGFLTKCLVNEGYTSV